MSLVRSAFRGARCSSLKYLSLVFIFMRFLFSFKVIYYNLYLFSDGTSVEGVFDVEADTEFVARSSWLHVDGDSESTTTIPDEQERRMISQMSTPGIKITSIYEIAW